MNQWFEIVVNELRDYFLSDNHSPNDIELVPLELIHSSRDALRKARDRKRTCMYVCMYVRTYVRTYVCMYACMYAYLIERGQTLDPKSINKREEI